MITDPRKCAKQETVAIIVNEDKIFIGSNWCESPQDSCPRKELPTGIGYELCKSVCHQKAHAEIDAIAKAGEYAKGGTLFLLGHYYCCENCKAAMDKAGIKNVVLPQKGAL